MKLKDKKFWANQAKINNDPYGKACVDVARRVMEILDDGKPFDTHKIICQADEETKVGGITGFMAGCVAQIVSKCHEREEEFRLQWNGDKQIGNEGDKANKSGVVLNPALLNVSVKD